MKMLKFLCCLVFAGNTGLSQTKFGEINPVLHDQSYVAAFGTMPGEGTPEELRIQTHLRFVENLLRVADTRELTESQSTNRAKVIELLNQYISIGDFPVNKDYAGERRPCFIDANGNICAVGYLVQQTRGRELAELINEKHQYDFLLDMNEPAIESWALEYGLTLEECAMIQPAYGPAPDPITRHADIPGDYSIASGLVGGSNVLINIAYRTGRWRYDPALPYFGLVTGTGQLIMGIANIQKIKTEPRINGGETITPYKKQNALSYVNIALGTTTIITSALNLAVNKKMGSKKNAFNLYSYPNDYNSVNMGLTFTRRI